MEKLGNIINGEPRKKMTAEEAREARAKQEKRQVQRKKNITSRKATEFGVDDYPALQNSLAATKKAQEKMDRKIGGPIKRTLRKAAAQVNIQSAKRALETIEGRTGRLTETRMHEEENLTKLAPQYGKKVAIDTLVGTYVGSQDKTAAYVDLVQKHEQAKHRLAAADRAVSSKKTKEELTIAQKELKDAEKFKSIIDNAMNQVDAIREHEKNNPAPIVAPETKAAPAQIDIKAAENQLVDTPENTPTTAPVQTVTQQEPLLDPLVISAENLAQVPERPKNNFDTYKETFAKAHAKDGLGGFLEQAEKEIPEFAKLSDGQKLILVKGLTDKLYTHIKATSKEEYAKDLSEKNFLGKMMMGVFKKQMTAKIEKDTLKTMMPEELTAFLKEIGGGLTETIKEIGVGAYLENGQIVFDFAKNTVSDSIPKEKISAYNHAATALAAIPYDWSTPDAPKKQQEAYKKAQEKFKTAQDSVLRGFNEKAKEGGSKDPVAEGMVTARTNELSIQMMSFLTTHPDAAAELRSIGNSSTIVKGLKDSLNSNAGYMAGGAGLRAGLGTILSGAGLAGTTFISAPIVGFVMGALRGHTRAKETIQSEAQDARSGKNIETNRQSRMLNVSVPTQRLELLLKRLKSSEVQDNPQELAILIKQIETRKKFMQDKLTHGEINFGSGADVISKQFQFMSAMHSAEVELAVQKSAADKNLNEYSALATYGSKSKNIVGQKDIQARLDNLQEQNRASIEKAREKYKLNQMLRSAVLGASFATVGAVVAHYAHNLGWVHNAPKTVAGTPHTEMNGSSVQHAAQSAKDTPAAVSPHETIKHTAPVTKQEGIDTTAKATQQKVSTETTASEPLRKWWEYGKGKNISNIPGDKGPQPLTEHITARETTKLPGTIDPLNKVPTNDHPIVTERILEKSPEGLGNNSQSENIAQVSFKSGEGAGQAVLDFRNSADFAKLPADVQAQFKGNLWEVTKKFHGLSAEGKSLNIGKGSEFGVMKNSDNSYSVFVKNTLHPKDTQILAKIENGKFIDGDTSKLQYGETHATASEAAPKGTLNGSARPVEKLPPVPRPVRESITTAPHPYHGRSTEFRGNGPLPGQYSSTYEPLPPVPKPLEEQLPPVPRAAESLPPLPKPRNESLPPVPPAVPTPKASKVFEDDIYHRSAPKTDTFDPTHLSRHELKVASETAHDRVRILLNKNFGSGETNNAMSHEGEHSNLWKAIRHTSAERLMNMKPSEVPARYAEFVKSIQQLAGSDAPETGTMDVEDYMKMLYLQDSKNTFIELHSKNLQE